MEGGIMTAVQTSNPVHDAEGAVEAGIHEVGATIDAVEREVGRGVSTRFPLNSAFIFTFGALGGMLFGFDTGIISGASPLIESDFGLSVAQTGFITSSVLIGSAREPVHRRAVRSFRPQEAADSGGDTVPARFGHVRGIHGIPE